MKKNKKKVSKWTRVLGIAIFYLTNFSLLGLAQEKYEFVLQWGSSGSGDSKFSSPEGIAVDSSGNVYVAEFGNNRIQKFTPEGNFITKWGSGGFGDGQFSQPHDLAVDTSGYIYVADCGNDRVQKFKSNGEFLGWWGGDDLGNTGWHTPGKTPGKRRIGVKGSGDGQFSGPVGIAVDSSGYVYVGEDGNQRIQKFTPEGNFITKWGSGGSGEGQFMAPDGIAVDSLGDVYVADYSAQRIQKFTKWGRRQFP